MKRWIHASRVIEHTSGARREDLNYDAVNEVLRYVEKACQTVTTHEGVNIEIEDMYNRFIGRFQIICEVMGGSFIETPEGFEVEIKKFGHYQQPELVNPKGFDSEYGFVSMEGKLPDKFMTNHYSPVNYALLSLNISSSSFDDCTITSGGEEIKVDDISHILENNLNRLSYQLDKLIHVMYEIAVKDLVKDQKAAAEKAQKMKDKAYNQPITKANLSKVIKELRKGDSKISVNSDGTYLRSTSYEDDFVSYHRLADMVEELNQKGIVLGEALDDPDIILNYGEVSSEGIHHAGDRSDYIEFRRTMNQKYGFKR